MPNPICVDLSHHNPTPDWVRLKAEGCLGVIHKATEGRSYVDDQLFKRAHPAMSAGLAWATYHFMRPGSMAEQVNHYLNTIDPRIGERMVLDHEDAGVTLDQLEEAVDRLLSIRPDVQVTIYSGHLIKEQLGAKRSDFLARNTSLWIAQYTSAANPSWPTATWPAWSLWQYTDQASVDGISAKVDGNRWNGPPETFVGWIGPAIEPAPQPEPMPEIESVDVVIKTSGKVTVSIVLNDELILSAKAPTIEPS